jgi:cell division protein FtsN
MPTDLRDCAIGDTGAEFSRYLSPDAPGMKMMWRDFVGKIFLNEPQAYELDQHYHHGENAHAADDQPCAADKEYQNEAPRVRRRSLALAVAICIFAVVVAAGAFGYREMFGGSVPPTLQPITRASNEPDKIAPASREQQAKNSDHASQADPAITSSISTAVPSKRAEQLAAANTTAEPNHTELAAVPIGLANASSPAEVTPRVLGGGYAVQVTSERSESRAQAGFRVLQAKYPNQLGGRQPIIRHVDLGATGTYYRALVGPFASAEKAARFCSGLKAAGGNCIIQKN